MLAEMVRLSYQHRAFYCYVILSVWIFLLVAGMYKYIGVDERISKQSKTLNNDMSIREYPRNLKSDIKTKKIFRFCNSPNEIKTDAEGKIDGLTLNGIVIITRHGDRGPLSHIRNISTVNCGGDFGTLTELENIYQNYLAFLQNVSSYSRTAWAQFLGPFHGFPMIPNNPRDCKIAQLTTVGIGQLLKTGIILRNAYYHKLNLGNGTISSKDVVVYSTRYRRTVQSAVALLYALLENDTFQNLAKITLQESQSYSFCYVDCVCPAVDDYLKTYSKEFGSCLKDEPKSSEIMETISKNKRCEVSDHLKSHPAVTELIKQVSNTVFEMPDENQSPNPNILRDALLTYVCHGASLPCVDSETQRMCVKTEHVTGLFAYTEWEAKQIAKSNNRKKIGLLKGYGLLRSIVTYMLRIISEAKPKVVLYSAHDKTLEYLATALGIISDRIYLPQYASRFIIEVYKINSKNENHVASDFYFRVLINGKDLTQEIPFCRNANFYSATYVEPDDIIKMKKDSKLCPIETIIRHLHDDYFVPFNTTNFKDACSNTKYV